MAKPVIVLRWYGIPHISHMNYYTYYTYSNLNPGSHENHASKEKDNTSKSNYFVNYLNNLLFFLEKHIYDK